MKQYTSTLKAWPGSFSVPDPDEFSGSHWKAWKDSMNKPKRGSYADTHLFGYAGLELIARFGKWDVQTADGEDLPLAVVQAWEDNPDDERVKLIAWVGREILFYNSGIIDPKE